MLHSRAVWAAEPDLDDFRRALDVARTDQSKALNMFEQLAERGSLQSMIQLGFVYSRRDKGFWDPGRAEYWLSRARDAGSVYGSYYLGLLYRSEKNYDNAIQEFRRGVEEGFTPAMVRLGDMYLKGDGVEVDIATARDLLDRAATLGHVHGRALLANMMVSGKLGIKSALKGLVAGPSVAVHSLKVALTEPDSDLLR